MEISLLAAFLGGTLALLNPCGALLLPGYFASSLTSRSELLAVYGAGMVVPLMLLAALWGRLDALALALWWRADRRRRAPAAQSPGGRG